MAEWRAARSDHKVITDAIANCANFLESIAPRKIDTMPRYAFSALLLELTPLGAHQFEVEWNARTGPKIAAAGFGKIADGAIHSSGPGNAAHSGDAQGSSTPPSSQETGGDSREPS